MSQLPWGAVRDSMKGDTGKVRVPDGWYDCKIHSAQAGQTGTKLEKVSARFIVLSGPYEGGSVFMDFILTPEKPGGLDLFGRRLKAIGITDDMLPDSLLMSDLAKLMVGRTAQLKVATRIFNDTEYDNILDMKPLADQGSGFSFGPGSVLPTPSPMPVPSGPSIPAMPIPTLSVTVPATSADGESGLPPEPPF